MAELAQIEKYTAIKRISDDASEDAFLDVGEPYVVQIATFGGRTLAQSVLAAQATVSDEFATCTVQSVFLNAGDAHEPTTYKVERASDTRTFAVRVVHAFQGDLEITTSTIRLQKIAEEGKAGQLQPYSTAMVDMGNAAPENMKSGFGEEYCRALGYTPEIWEMGPTEAFDWRHLPFLIDTPDRPDQFRMRSFVKTESPMQSDHHASHFAALAWISDLYFVPSGILANYASITKANKLVKLASTLNHAITFHEQMPRMDRDWIAVERKTTWSDGGRLHLEQRMWNKTTGKMVMSSTQDLLVRLSNL